MLFIEMHLLAYQCQTPEAQGGKKSLSFGLHVASLADAIISFPNVNITVFMNLISP